MLESQEPARIEEHRLVAVLEQVDVALEVVVGHVHADPPDPIGGLDGVAEIDVRADGHQTVPELQVVLSRFRLGFDLHGSSHGWPLPQRLPLE